MMDNILAYYGGLKHSYLAYITWLREVVSEPPLPKFEDYSPEQMFWISYAKLWCSKYETKSNKRVILSDSQMSNEVLVNVLLRGLPEFSADFHCKNDSFMKYDSSRTCDIWVLI